MTRFLLQLPEGLIYIDMSFVFVLFWLIIVFSVAFFGKIKESTGLSNAKKLELYKAYRNGGQFMKKTGNYGIALLNVFSTVVKADGKVYNAEIDFIRGYLYNRFFENNYSARNLSQYHIHSGIEEDLIINGMMLFDEIYRRKSNLDQSCEWIGKHVSLSERKELLWFLFRLSKVNRSISYGEQRLLKYISDKMGISDTDFTDIKGEFIQEKKQRKSFFDAYTSSYSKVSKAYQLLGVTSANSNKEIKDAFRKLARQYHPDRFARDTEEKRKWAEDKFSEINAAYDEICKKRGIK